MNQWNKIAHYYDQLMSDDGDIIRQYLYDPAILNNLDHVKGKTILDAGCGNGYWSRKLAFMGAKKIYAIDTSSKLLEHARKRTNNVNIQYSTADIAKHLPFDESSFDIIISNLVLDYLSDLETTALEFFRVLKPDGILIVGIQHPLYHLGYSLKQNPKQLSKKYKESFGYFDRAPLTKLSFENMPLTIFNRTFGDYINTFTLAGLNLLKVIEPEYNEVILNLHPEYNQKRMIPRFLILKFKKN